LNNIVLNSILANGGFYHVKCCRVSVYMPVLYKAAKRRIMQTTPYDSPGTLVFWCQRSRQNSNSDTPNGSAK